MKIILDKTGTPVGIITNNLRAEFEKRPLGWPWSMDIRPDSVTLNLHLDRKKITFIQEDMYNRQRNRNRGRKRVRPAP